ncbi:unnamed protein product [Parnassius apollo]|uniref:(apollo) hypothetical protein n=1 Tax=Parnassius apollo TaxID=110799 RepID=A0A8S3WF92_PARAO|nr:unnamed protein product [Parnassius apollo]
MLDITFRFASNSTNCKWSHKTPGNDLNSPGNVSFLLRKECAPNMWTGDMRAPAGDANMLLITSIINQLSTLVMKCKEKGALHNALFET